MKYFEELISKYGFQDGATVPDGANAYREVYCAVMNALLEHADSAVRVMPYDRSGRHNRCMIAHLSAGQYAALGRGLPVTALAFLDPDDPDEMDAGYRVAYTKAMDLGLDDYVTVTVLVCHDELSDLLTQITDEEESPHD